MNNENIQHVIKLREKCGRIVHPQVSVQKPVTNWSWLRNFINRIIHNHPLKDFNITLNHVLPIRQKHCKGLSCLWYSVVLDIPRSLKLPSTVKNHIMGFSLNLAWRRERWPFGLTCIRWVNVCELVQTRFVLRSTALPEPFSLPAKSPYLSCTLKTSKG